MKKALAILATVATVGATTMSAPAEARGWRGGWGGPGLAFGLAAGAITAGAVAASGIWAGLRVLRLWPSLLRTWAIRVLRQTLLSASLLPALRLLVIGKRIDNREKPGASLRAFCLGTRTSVQAGGAHFPAW